MIRTKKVWLALVPAIAVAALLSVSMPHLAAACEVCEGSGSSLQCSNDYDVNNPPSPQIANCKVRSIELYGHTYYSCWGDVCFSV